MFRFIKKTLAVILTFFNLLSINSLEFVTMSNQECKARPNVIDVNSNEPMFHLYSIKVNKCSGTCSSINNPFSTLCVLDIIKNINVKVFNLMQRINETRHIIWHETRKCICRLTVSVCNNNQRWNKDKCKCKCREDLIDKGICDKGFIWNPSNCERECDKPCGIGEYLDYQNCVYRNTLSDKLVEECTDVINGYKIYNETLNVIPSDDCASYTPDVALFVVFLTTSVIIVSVFVYFYWRSKKRR